MMVDPSSGRHRRRPGRAFVPHGGRQDRRNSGKLEVAQHIANHESPRTTKLYDRAKERLTQDEVERIRL
jgi:hypothetical protein